MRRLAVPIALTFVVWAAGAEHDVQRMKRAPPRPGPVDLSPTVSGQDEPIPALAWEVPPDPEKPRTILPCLLPSSLRGVVVDPDGFGVGPR